MPPPSPELRAHQEWLGYIQPVGLVVSPPALLAAQAYVNRNVIAEQEKLRGLAPNGVIDRLRARAPRLGSGRPRRRARRARASGHARGRPHRRLRPPRPHLAIVATTLQPILEALGPKPKPEQILDLKVCDPAMGSGAFLVETCRHLGEALVAAWEAHGRTPRDIPPDEDVLLHARRLVAQRCLYGVDKNPFAVDLAKLSLWLATLAKDHPFTFLDHSLRCGDSLVGLSRQQIASFD